MSNLFCSSIGKKLVMSLTGLFMMVFLVVHLVINLTLLCPNNNGEAYNAACEFMATNPMIKIMEPVLAAGFLFHIVYALILTARNMKARPVGYAQSQAGMSSAWASRNMVALGVFILAFLVVHVANFWWKMKMTDLIGHGPGQITDYELVSGMFKGSVAYSLGYIVAFLALGFHLTHGFWSAFQSLGANNRVWFKRLKCLGTLYAVAITVGFTIIPVYFMIK